MPFPHFSGPYIFRMLTKAFTWEVLRRLPETVPKQFSGGSPMPFADFSGSYTVWDLNF